MTVPIALSEKFEEAKKLVLKNQRFLVVSHEYTDGDDLGAILAFGRVLERMEKQAILAAKGGIPDSLLFLPGHNDVHDSLPANYNECEVLVTIGCGDMKRTGYEELLKWSKPILNIDHHSDTQMFGTVNVWDQTAAANSELLYLLIQDWGIEIDKFIALNLLTGIFTDTGGFHHANVTAQTLEIAAELLRKGAKLDLISRFTQSQKELPMLRAWSVALEHTKFDPIQKIVYTVITDEDLKKANAAPDSLEGIVELLNTIPEAKFSMLLKQRGNEIKGSLRSEPHKGVDVSEIARAFGGGGHKLAAGFKFKGRIERTKEGWKIT
ncbi:MAG: bifunctional oligoribonuclease/PAP phosphatase NrnA [bacterium]|nr:bifunctional oligoribonuclease/PAP phosphatase NrnA [bacterium]